METKTCRSIVALLSVVFMFTFFTLFFALPSATAADEIVFALVDDLSGSYASTGEDNLKGLELAVEEAGHKVIGKKIKVIKRDTQLKPAVGVRKFREVVEQEHPVFVASACSSAVQLAMQEVANNTKTLFWTGGWSSKLTTAGTVNRYTFRWASPNFAIARSSVAGFMKKFPEAKNFYFITMDYAWGHNITKEATEVIEELGGKVVGNIFTPLKETDYSSAITKALSAKPDVIMLNQFGSPLIKSARTVNEFGAKDRAKILIPGAGLTMLRGVGSYALEGMYVGAHWWHTVDNDYSKKFTAKFRKKYNKEPSYSAISFYLMANLTMDAIKRCGSTDVDKIICELEGYKYNGPDGKEEVRAFDHQIIHPYLLGIGKKPSEKKYSDDYLKIIGSSEVYRTYKQNPVKWNLKLQCGK